MKNKATAYTRLLSTPDSVVWYWVYTLCMRRQEPKHIAWKPLLLLALFFLVSWSGASFAHSPIFMLAPEAPGKEAFDLHTGISHTRQGDDRYSELEQEFTYGITRDLALGFAIPLAREERASKEVKQTAKMGIENPEIFTQWRFWDRDVLGAKYSSALRLTGAAPLGDKSIASEKPSFMAGLSYGMESLKWYYFVDARYLHNLEDDGSKRGDRFFADAAVGLRPHLGKLEETDTVFFLEFNFMNEQRSKTGGAGNPDSGGSYLSVSPEVLISPTNRLLIRGGVQIPIYQAMNGTQAPKDFTFKLVIETRY
ncbi:MAG: hypothetical protein IEMM0002_0127 [bacterium]|nr:MAG: hypothetical protein IEMM0002_0127 [bacterium]